VVAGGSFPALNNNPQTWSPDWCKWNTEDDPLPNDDLIVARELQSPPWFAPSEMLYPNIPEQSAVSNNADQAFTPQLHSERHLLWSPERPLGSGWAQQVNNTNAPAFLPLDHIGVEPDWASFLSSAEVDDIENGTCEPETDVPYDRNHPRRTSAVSWLKDLASFKMWNSRRSSPDSEHSFRSRLGEFSSRARKAVSRQKPELPENNKMSQYDIALHDVQKQPDDSAYSPSPDTSYRRNTCMSSSSTELSGVGFAHRPNIRQRRGESAISELSSGSEGTYGDGTGRTRSQTLDVIHKLGMKDKSDAAEYERLEAERRARELATPSELEGEGHSLRPFGVSRYADALEAITEGIEAL
jgi:hypothetical protein